MAATIYINGRFLTQPNTGVQRYAQEIMKGFDLLLGADQTGYAGIRMRCLVPPGTDLNVPWKHIPCEAVGIHRGNLWEQIDLPFHLKGGFLFSPANTGPLFHANQAVTFHDASVFAVPRAYLFAFKLKYRLIFFSLSRLAKVKFTDSKFSQQELALYLRRPAHEFKVIPLAGDHIHRAPPDLQILKKLNLVKNGYYLAVGSHSLHKNISALRSAIEMTKCDVKYVFAGGEFNKVFNQASDRAERANIIKAGYVTDEELKALYLNALGYVFPSSYEGFGIPVLEAMQCGCPVICSRAASLPEAAGEAALYFDPSRPDELAGALDALFYDLPLREELVRAGHRQAAKFSWSLAARSTLDNLIAPSGA